MHPTQLSSSIEQYCQYLTERNYARASVEGRLYALRAFVRWCENRGIYLAEEVDTQDLLDYREYLDNYRKKDGDPLGDACKSHGIATIRNFLFYLVRSGRLEENPGKNITVPRAKKVKKNRGTTEEIMEAILESIDTESLYGLRDRAILETLYSTGIRRMELCNLHLYDLDISQGTLTIRQGKGKKDRVVPIGQRALFWTELYLSMVRPYLVRSLEEPALFLSRLGRPLSKERLWSLVSQYIKAVTGKSAGCHLFRHTAATLMLSNGADIRFIQQFLGHRHLSTTETYTPVSFAKLQESYLKAHPAHSGPS